MCWEGMASYARTTSGLDVCIFMHVYIHVSMGKDDVAVM